jgi:hypothetical protein
VRRTINTGHRTGSHGVLFGVCSTFWNATDYSNDVCPSGAVGMEASMLYRQFVSLVVLLAEAAPASRTPPVTDDE